MSKWKNFALKVAPYLIILLVAFIWSTISPLYKYAYTLVDFNCTFSIAKAIGHGQVYFKDIFEQRGIYLYFLHLPAAFLPYTIAKNVIWCFEVINLWLFYFIVQKTSKSRWISCLGVSSLLLLPVFSNAVAPEEWCLVPLAYSVYLLVKFNKTKKLRLRDSLLLGITMGYVINVKYNQMMFIAGLYFGIGLYLLINKQFKRFWQTVGTAISGVIIDFIPAVVYFAVNNAVTDWLKGYFLDNASSINLANIGGSLLYYLLLAGIFLAFAAMPAALEIVRLNKAMRLIVLSQAVFGILGVILIGRSGVSYAMPILAYFMILAVCGSKYVKPFMKQAPNGFNYLIIIAQIFVCVVYGIKLIQSNSFTNGILRVPNVAYYRDNNTSRSMYYESSHLIDKFGGGSAMTYGTVTNSVYLFNHEYPKVYYFDQTTMSYKRYAKSFNEQNRYIDERKVRWIDYLSSVTCRPDSMSQKEFAYQINKLNKASHRITKLSPATVTAPKEYQDKHESDFIKMKPFNLRKDHVTYYFDLDLPKNLYNNYDLVYLSATDNISNDYHTLGGFVMLWCDKNYVAKHPDLTKHVIQLDSE